LGLFCTLIRRWWLVTRDSWMLFPAKRRGGQGWPVDGILARWAILDTGFLILDAGCLILDAGCSILDCCVYRVGLAEFTRVSTMSILGSAYPPAADLRRAVSRPPGPPTGPSSILYSILEEKSTEKGERMQLGADRWASRGTRNEGVGIGRPGNQVVGMAHHVVHFEGDRTYRT
jgi:hypothetical protein